MASLIYHRVLHHILRSAVLGLATITGLQFAPSAQAAGVNAYAETRLVSNGTINNTITDDNLTNPWGLAASPSGPFWVGNNASGTTTAYDGSGNNAGPIVTIPAAIGLPGPANPTGVVFNPTNKFIVKAAAKSGPAEYVFVNEDGAISGWNFNVNSTNAIKMVDRSSSQAIYKGVAIAHNGTSDFLYAANFHSGAIDVFDNRFRVAHLTGTFNDETIPADFSPFNIQTFNNKLYVTYAKADTDKEDDIAGAGNGIIDVFNPDGTLVRRLVSNGRLNSPWGMAVAPSNFGKFSKNLLVGNFGDGKINAYDIKTGKLKGTLKDAAGHAIVNEGLWGLSFGNGTLAGKTNQLFFTAGPNEEVDGVFGRIKAVNATASPQTIAVPEPSSMFLLISTGFLALRRRR